MPQPHTATPGQYVLHHPDYTNPVEITLRKNNHDTFFWSAFGKTRMLFANSTKEVWETIYRDLNVDRRPPNDVPADVLSRIEYTPK